MEGAPAKLDLLLASQPTNLFVYSTVILLFLFHCRMITSSLSHSLSGYAMLMHSVYAGPPQPIQLGAHIANF